MQIVNPDEVLAATIASALTAIRPKVSARQFSFLQAQFEADGYTYADDGLGKFSPRVMLYGKIGGLVSKALQMRPDRYHCNWATRTVHEPDGVLRHVLRPNFVEALKLAGWFALPTPHAPGAQVKFPLLKEVNLQFDERVRASIGGDRVARLKRLATAPKKPEQFMALTAIFRRNPDVVAEVLHCADGVCAGCRSRAPFIRASDGIPYLEVHHRVLLAEGGDDSVNNAEALCPNCHRARHFAKVTAVATSWIVQPQPSEREPLGFVGSYSQHEAEQLACGCIPEQMEDRWFIYYADGWLRFHRSWTGAYIFALKLEKQGENTVVVQSWVSREEGTFLQPDVVSERALVKGVINALLLMRSDVSSTPERPANEVHPGLLQRQFPPTDSAQPNSPVESSR